jgi:hypothetical protein
MNVYVMPIGRISSRSCERTNAKSRIKKAPKRAGLLRLSCLLSANAKGSLGCDMDPRAWIGVFPHPQRAIGAFFHIAVAAAHIPALGGFGAAVAGFSSETDSGKRLTVNIGIVLVFAAFYLRFLRRP